VLLVSAADVVRAAAPPAVLAPAGADRRTPVVIAVEKAGPAVVNISTEKIITRRSDPFFEFRDPMFDEFFRDWFDRFHGPRRRRTSSLGSGVIIDPEGYVVTNEHVVHRASKIHLTLSDGTKVDGKLLSSDASSDLALIKVDAEKPLPALPLGESDDLMIGETVIALGNPFGLESTVTTGVVSAKERSVHLRGQEAYAGLIQTDAAINPGNSGGALINIHGQLIGINVAIHAQAQGIGFAIPVDRVREVLVGLFNYRVINKTYIGIKSKDLTPKDRARHRVPKGIRGALVTGVDAESPATEAGLATGDVIVAVGGAPVRDRLTFFKQMLKQRAGERLVLRVQRGRRSRSVALTVGTVPKPSGKELARRRLGVALQPMTRELARSFGLRRPAGLIVSDVEAGGPADEAGLERGDVILRIGPLTVNSLERLAILLEQVDDARADLLIVRGRRLYRARVRLRPAKRSGP
jgi:serine protease Do